MIEVTEQEMRDFVESQPDNRPIDFAENSHSDSCGCLMVQYGWHRQWLFDRVGMTKWISKEPSRTEVACLVGCTYTKFIPEIRGVRKLATNYGEVKKWLRRRVEMDLDEMQNALRKTLSLLDDRQRGTMSWNMLLDSRFKEIAAILKKAGYLGE